MKNVLRICSVLTLFAFLFSSCSGNLSVEKRHYRNGFYVHNSGKNQPATSEAVLEKEVVTSETKTFTQEPVAATEANPVKEEKTTAQTPVAEKQNPVRAKNPVVKPAPASEKPTVKETIKTVKAATHKKPGKPAASDEMILLVILAILLPPLAIYLKTGITNLFWIDLICFLLGGGLIFSPYFYGGGLWLAAIVIALLVVLDVI